MSKWIFFFFFCKLTYKVEKYNNIKNYLWTWVEIKDKNFYPNKLFRSMCFAVFNLLVLLQHNYYWSMITQEFKSYTVCVSLSYCTKNCENCLWGFFLRTASERVFGSTNPINKIDDFRTGGKNAKKKADYVVSVHAKQNMRVYTLQIHFYNNKKICLYTDGYCRRIIRFFRTNFIYFFEMYFFIVRNDQSTTYLWEKFKVVDVLRLSYGNPCFYYCLCW